MRIQIKNLQNLKRINLVSLEKRIKKILKYLNLSNKTVYIVLSDNRLIRKLNKAFLGKNEPTDVIAFPLGDRHTQDLLGEVIVSIEQAIKNTRVYRTIFEEELLLYLIHGILHLSGYDDQTKHQRAEMQAKERELLTRILKK
jgi:probable rRNA maturation factor